MQASIITGTGAGIYSECDASERPLAKVLRRASLATTFGNRDKLEVQAPLLQYGVFRTQYRGYVQRNRRLKNLLVSAGGEPERTATGTSRAAE